MLAMKRINQLMRDKRYEEYLRKNDEAERQRVYCRHGADHGLNVARIAYIYLLEQGADAGQTPDTHKKEIVYGAALLHDIGRWIEYASGEDHALASARLAEPLLRENGFDTTEVAFICQAIGEHRLKPEETTSSLGKALALADDWARDCRQCSAKSSCYKYTTSLEEIWA